MEPSVVEQRVKYLEERVKTLEDMLGVSASPVRVREPFPAAPVPPEQPPPAAAPSARDLEELLGGRVLGWVGGVAVALAAVFFVVMAVRNGWIGEAARMELAFAASVALAGGGAWLYERRGRTQAALSTVAAGIAALYATDAATTLHYHLISSTAGLVIAGVVGSLALATAVRWRSQEIAGIGIVGSLLAPVFVGAGPHTSSLVFMTIALVAAIGVVVQRGWSWLAVVAYVVSAPQAASWLDSEHTTRLGTTLVVAVAFWLLYVVAAIGHEIRMPSTTLRLSSASLLFANASVTAAGGWWLIDDAGHHTAATWWLVALACAHVVLGTIALRSPAYRELALLPYGVAAALLAVSAAIAFSGPVLVAAWSIEAVVLALIGRRSNSPDRGLAAAIVLAGLACAHTLVFEARPDSLAYGLHSIPAAMTAVLLVLLAFAAIAVTHEDLAEHLAWAGAALGVYLSSAVVVDLAGAHAGHSTQTSQLALSGFWAALGFAAIVVGLLRSRRTLRFGGLGLLTLAVGKVFVVDLANLESIWRVGSFLAVGLVLLGGAFAYQRVSRTVEA